MLLNTIWFSLKTPAPRLVCTIAISSRSHFEGSQANHGVYHNMLDVSKFIQPGTWGSYDMGKIISNYLESQLSYEWICHDMSWCQVKSPVVRLDPQNGASYPQPPPFGALFLGGTGHLLARKPRLKLALWHQSHQNHRDYRTIEISKTIIDLSHSPIFWPHIPPSLVTRPLHPEARLETLRGRRTSAGGDFRATLGQGCQSGAQSGRSARAAPGW